MKSLQLLFLCSSILAVSSCITVDGYSCVSAFWDTVSCVVNVTDNPMEQTNSTYSLKFTNTRGDKTKSSSCPLTVKNHSHSCVCKVVSTGSLSSHNGFNIQVCNDSGCQSLIEEFKPSHNIQPTAPREVKVHQTPEAFNITWKSGYEDHPYLNTNLDYELLLHKAHSSGTTFPQKLSSRDKFESIPRLQIEAPATFCTKVRSKTFEKKKSKFNAYRGTWSQWSPQICWENDMQEAFLEQGHILVTLTKSLGPVCVVVGVLLFVFSSPTVRMKIKTLSHTPSPAPFFQPLHQQHDGNLQEWLCPQGKSTLLYSTDEIVITDAVTVIPKPIMKDPEENQDFHNLTLMPLTFSQCQTSYVGAPGIQGASQPVTVICPGDTPYTQLPCSVWGCGTDDVQVVPCPPEDLLDTSLDDSGCSCNDVTPSPECSLPNSPTDESSPPCYCPDYCILNKTATGMVPVLVK